MYNCILVQLAKAGAKYYQLTFLKLVSYCHKCKSIYGMCLVAIINDSSVVSGTLADSVGSLPALLCSYYNYIPLKQAFDVYSSL